MREFLGFSSLKIFIKFDDMIKFNIVSLSSDPKEHTITIDDVEYCTVGNKEQFDSQFKRIF